MTVFVHREGLESDAAFVAIEPGLVGTVYRRIR